MIACHYIRFTPKKYLCVVIAPTILRLELTLSRIISVFLFLSLQPETQIYRNTMKSIPVLLFTGFLSLLCQPISAQNNPFMEMAGKKYADYSLDLYYKYIHFDIIDSTGRQKMIDQIKEVAVKTGSKAWALELEYAELAEFDVINRGSATDYKEKEIKMAFDILDEAKKNHILYMELKVRSNIIETYWLKLKNYELAFDQCAIQAERLQTVSSDDIPEKKVYQENTLSIDSLAILLEYKKRQVSEAINHCTNTNFHAFINEYRIKEAIRLLSDIESKIDLLDDIAYAIGFNDRTSFHRAFKKITGLSPLEFRKPHIVDRQTAFLYHTQCVCKPV